MADEPLFLGVEHVGLYSDEGKGNAQQVVDWYKNLFGFEAKEGNSSFFVAGPGAGRLEILKAPSPERCHVAIEVSDFDKAVEALRAQGIEFETPKGGGSVRGIFLKQRDPTGNLVHLFWQAK
jgi:catechol 2,3-dioxygenase-like lactoylglutathione lyase family enzyme